MPITVTISKTITDPADEWITDEQAKGLLDSVIIDLIKEDLYQFADGACWTVSHDSEVDGVPV